MITSLLREQLGVGYVSTMIVSPDGKTVYFGRYQSYEHNRMNLGVLLLDSHGQPIGEIKYFRDCTENIPLNHRSSVIKISIDSSHPVKKLYLISASNLSPSANERCFLSIYDLDSHGYPISSTLASFPSPILNGGNNSLYSFALGRDKI